MFRQDVDTRPHGFSGNHAFLNHGEIWLQNQSAIECGDWDLQLKIVDQHLHASWRTTARDGERDARLGNRVNSGARPGRQELVRRKKCAVDIGNDQSHRC